MAPKRSSVAHLIQFCNSHAIFIRWDMFSFDIHCDFTEIKVCTDTGRRSYPCRIEHIQDHLHRQLTGCHLIGFQISRRINQYLIYRIDMDIFRGDIFQIDLVYF